ncbi:uncharacterized protein LOC110817409 [Carica papaya]|uniref:uncharacterized protein LOC110817409 n=1 Tax=Carica papaya TaxID=3649 RepID=UPI000B8C9D9B|nr:uncharacterized protein LOC110817409 [Carica papaya]
MSSSRKKTSDLEVEQLLEAAQDELLLNLSVNSHSSRISPDYLHPDLLRRFQELKSRPSLAPPRPPRTQHSSSTNRGDVAAVDDDDLSARFAALKASLPSSSQSVPVDPRASLMDGRVPGNDHEDEDDEVEKLIKWAMDAARLDPSPPSDDDNNHEGIFSDEDDDDSDCDNHDRKTKRRHE